MTPEELTRARGCECLSKLDAQIKVAHGEDADLQLGGYILTDPNAEQWEQYSDLLPLAYKWKEKRKVRTGHFNFTFCPFCGKKKS